MIDVVIVPGSASRILLRPIVNYANACNLVRATLETPQKSPEARNPQPRRPKKKKEKKRKEISAMHRPRGSLSGKPESQKTNGRDPISTIEAFQGLNRA